MCKKRRYIPEKSRNGSLLENPPFLTKFWIVNIDPYHPFHLVNIIVLHPVLCIGFGYI